MTAHAVAQRLTVYANRADDPTEATILTPAAGAPHSDNFKVTTLPSLAGWKPYLVPLVGRTGSLDPLTKKVTLGSYRIRILDARVTAGGSHASRWGTGFIGDAMSRPACLGCKVYVEESLDDGTTWAAFKVLRVTRVLVSDAWFELETRDLAEEFRQMQVFGQRPSASIAYVVEPMACPVGMSEAYGQVEATDPFDATVAASTHASGYRMIELDAASIVREDNLITNALFREGFQLYGGSVAVLRQLAAGVGVVRLNPALRLRFSAAGLGITDKELQIVRMYPGAGNHGHLRVLRLLVTALQKADGTGPATSDPYYSAFDTGTVPNATAITCSLRLVQVPSRDEEQAEFFLTAVNPAAFWQDILDGYFSRLYQAEDDLPSGAAVGDPVWSIPYDSAAFAALTSPGAATDALPDSFWRITTAMSALEFIEKYICQPYALGYRFVPDGSGTPTCRLEPVDLRLPNVTALGTVPALDDDDLDVETENPAWAGDAMAALTDIRVKYATDTVLPVEDVLADTALIPDIPPSRIWPSDQWAAELVLGRAVALGRRTLTIEAPGIRGAEDPLELSANLQRDAWAERTARRCIDHYRQLFGTGPATIHFRARRTARTTGLYPGDWCTADFSAVPNLSTNVRGGIRLYLVTGRTEDGASIVFDALESGVASGATAPTVGTPTQTSGYTKHSIDCAVTVNAASDWVEMRIAVKDTSYGTSAPAVNDSSWVVVGIVKATGTLAINNLPSGKRVFVQGRSVAQVNLDGTLRKLPSAWTGPSGTKYVDTASYTAPSSVVVIPDPVTNTATVTVTWTNGESTLPVEVRIDDGGGYVRVARLAAGSVGPVTLNAFLLANGSYTLAVRHLDALGGATADGTDSFTTPVGFTGPTLTVPTLTILQGG